MIEQRLRAGVRIDAEFLRQVAQGLAHLFLALQHVDLAEHGAAAVGFLQRGQDAHQRRLAGAVGPEQAEHARRDRQADVVQRLHAVGIGLADVAESELHGRQRGAMRGREVTNVTLTIHQADGEADLFE